MCQPHIRGSLFCILPKHKSATLPFQLNDPVFYSLSCRPFCVPRMSDLLLTESTDALDLFSAITRPLEVATGRYHLSVLKAKPPREQLPVFHASWRCIVTGMISIVHTSPLS